MPPSPDESSPTCGITNPDAPISGDSVVISGMSALMPGCRGLDEFAEKLYNMENLVTGEKPRWKFNHPEMSPYHGIVPNMEYFDSQFFMIHYRLSQSTDAMCKKLLEQSYQAIIDAGVCPTELYGKRVGVFVATGINDMHRMFTLNAPGTELLGSTKTMVANRISYWLNTKGPSYTLDASCCGSLVALERARDALVHGDCDAAIVGAARFSYNPLSSIHYGRMVPLNQDGKTKCYDMNADGQTLSEAVITLFIQKYKDARRVYAEIYHIKSNYSEGLGEKYKEKFGPYRDSAKVAKFFQEFYKEAGVSTSSVEYVEGHGTASADVDKAELEAIEQVFCRNRSKPLLVGSVVSNMGFADAASGLCGVVKLLLAYKRGGIAANLHCENPRLDIASLQNKRMRIVTKHEQFDRSFTALNNFSVTGVNAHILLKGYYKNKDVSSYHCGIPRMVTVSGRQEPAVQKLLNSIKYSELDPEEIALYHETYKKRIQKHMARGYGIYATESKKTVSLCEKAAFFDDARRPLWFVYSGMGSQWAGMGSQLMRIPIFAAAIERCAKVLMPKGVDVVKIITSPDEKIFDSILNSFVGISAIQIGLTDILHAVGLVPNYIIGHSVGELGCAYADGCCTTEDVMLLSYNRGLVSTQMSFIEGSMAAVGVGYRQSSDRIFKLSKICPPDIDVACHNGPDSSTISGPAEAVQKFVSQLTSRGIFVKEVNCSNIPYHSRYVAKAGPELLRYTKEIIKEPKLRSERWLSTSVPLTRWHENSAKYSSPEYHTNNLASPVLFEETCRLVPSGAVLVEVAPHGLLQAILKRSLSPDCRHVPLTKRGCKDNALFFLGALGSLYMEGYDLDISKLYPKVEFPVSTQTRQLSHLVDWVHTEKWNVGLYVPAEREFAAVYKPIVTTYDEEYKYLEGAIIEDNCVFPLSGALVFVWDTLSMISRNPLRETSVQFHNVKYHKQLVLQDNKALPLVVMLQRCSGRFEVTHRNLLVVEGYIFAEKTTDTKDFSNLKDKNSMMMNSSDIYKLLFERGYKYKHDFRAIYCSNLSLTNAQLIWINNWVTFIDGALQLCTLKHNHNFISLPQYINRICININSHQYAISNAGDDKKHQLFEATVFEDQNAVRCGGLSIENIIFKDKQLHKKPVILKNLTFIPFFQDANGDFTTTLYVFIQIVAEHVGKDKISMLNITDIPVQEQLHSMLNRSQTKLIDVMNVTEEHIKTKQGIENNPNIIILDDTTCNANVLGTLHHLNYDVFLITHGLNIQDLFNSSSYEPVSTIGSGLSRMELAHWKSRRLSTVALTLDRPEDLDDLITTRKNLKPHQKLVAFISFPLTNDLKNLVNQWRRDSDRNQVYLAMINDKYKVDMKQLPSFKAVFNIFNQNTWGGEYYIPLKQKYTGGPAALQCSQMGDLSSLYWVQQLPETNHPAGHLKIEVHYAEVNVYDAQRALARIPVKNTQNQGFGMGFSGITESGTRVMGLRPNGCAAGQIWSGLEYLWPVPKHWSLEDAATVPLAYAIAFYCLVIKSKLVPGATLLIHGGAGALGQAAISIALGNGCEVFTTVGDHHKKTFLAKLFPNLPVSHIGNSRDDTFRDMVLNITKGKGCDIVLSCVREPLKHVTLGCCAAEGTTFDVVQIHTQDNFDFGMFNMTKSRSYRMLDVPSIFFDRNRTEFKKIRSMISEGISRGYVLPLSRVTYAPDDAARAFCLLAASRHRGRVLLRMRETLPPAQIKLTLAPDACHIIMCDEDEFGIYLASRLVDLGVKKLHITVPKISNYLSIKRQLWKKNGVEVKIVSNTLGSIKNLQKLFDEGNGLGPIEAIYVIATDDMDMNTKVTVNSEIFCLDSLSRKLCPKLRYFVVINEDNSIGHEVCQRRNQINLNSLSLQVKLQKFAGLENKNDELIWCSAVDVIETALLSNKTFVSALQIVQPQSILEEVVKIPGVVITRFTDDRIPLKQLGLEPKDTQEISSLLEEKFNMNVPKDMVPFMTVGQLKKLKVQTIDLNKEVPGFGGFFSYIDNDEMLASCELVYMPTLTHSSTLKPEEYEENENYLCIVPGMEGHHERFRAMCKLLKMPAVVLQLGLDERQENIQEIAQRLVNVLMKKLKLQNQFYLLGYELGVPIVIEMATILESCGLTGTVYCVGGTPNDVRAVLENKLQGMSEKMVQVALLQQYHYLIFGETSPQLDHNLRDRTQYSDKVKFFVESLRGRVPHSSQYVQKLLEVAHSRVTLMYHYCTEFKVLKAKMVIVRAKLPRGTPVCFQNSLQSGSCTRTRTSRSKVRGVNKQVFRQ